MEEHILISNTIMELLFINGSSNGLSETQKTHLILAWSYLTDKGKKTFTKWAIDNNRKIPVYLN